MARLLEIKYMCRCMTEEASLFMRQRDPNEDIMAFMKKVQAVIGADHHNRSPLCLAKTMSYVKIPIDQEGDIIGQAPKLDS